MRKKEFLRQISMRLKNVNRNEKIDILNYYDELVEDTIERTGKTEAEVIYDLGDIDDIIRRVYPEHSRYDEKIIIDEPVRSRSSRRHPERRTKRVGETRSTIGVIFVVILSPLWFSLLVTLFSLIIAFVAIGIAIVAASLASIWNGVGLIAGNLTNGLFLTGAGIALFGAALILMPLIIKIIVLISKSLINFIKWIFMGSSQRRYSYEN